jgi:AcrR family transcriptional regulator
LNHEYNNQYVGFAGGYAMKKEKKEALTEFHRNTIQYAAEKLFLEKGVEATSIEEIAKHAGYSKATLYVYFKSKADIWNNILLSATKMLKEKVESTVSSDCGAIEKYFAMCETITDFSEEYPLYFESLLGLISLEDEELNRRIYEVGDEIMNGVSQLITQGIKEGVISPEVKFPSIAFIFWSSISGMIRMTNQKVIYFQATARCRKKELLRYGFETLLKSIAK